MSRYHPLAGLVGIAALAIPSTQAQIPAATPKFEVASVKRNPECGARRGGARPGTPGRISLECQTVLGLIMTAYGVFADGKTVSSRIPEITGGPGWVSSDTYDVTAKAEGDAPFPQMAGPMLRDLLEDRFKLKVRTETREVPVYFLTVAKNGPKLQPSKEGSCVPIDPNHPPAPVLTPGQPRPVYCGQQTVQNVGSAMTLIAQGVTLQALAEIMLSHMAGRPVIDKTGLTGRFDIHLDFAPEGAASQPATPADAPSIFEALQSRLGLKLEPGKGPVQSLVIDSVERPSGN